MEDTMDTIESLFDKYLEGIEITPEEKKSLQGLYFISYNKMIIEVLTGLLGHKPEFQSQFAAFVSSTQKIASPEEQNTIAMILEEGKKDALKELFTVFSKNLPEEMKVIVEKNMSSF